MKAPQCKICQLHHYGICKIVKAKDGKIEAVVIPPQPGGVTGKRPKQVIADDVVKKSSSEAKSIVERINEMLYMPDGTVNEEAARAGHNAYIKLAMRKHRAKKKDQRNYAQGAER